MTPRAAEPPPDGELALQRRWAEGRWPSPWLRPERGGPPLRVHFAGRWNRGPGPDFRGAILLDAQGRARRGDVELHRRPAGWRSHGHHLDPAYDRVLLHVVGDATGQHHGPPAALLPPDERAELPPALQSPQPPQPPCARVLRRAGAPAVAARLRRLARARLARKTAALRRKRAHWQARGHSPAESRELLACWALARAIGMPRNAAITAAALEAVWPRITASHANLAGDPTADVTTEQLAAELTAQLAAQLTEELAARPGWRRGRGALGAPLGAAQALGLLLARWQPGQAAAACIRLAQAAPTEAAQALRIPRLLGPARARQLLADAVYPAALTLSALSALNPPDPAAAAELERRWLNLPAVRYQRTDPLRERLRPLPFRHAEAQALLDLERAWCAQAACAVCPLARLAPERPRPAALIPSLNLPPPLSASPPKTPQAPMC